MASSGTTNTHTPLVRLVGLQARIKRKKCVCNLDSGCLTDTVRKGMRCFKCFIHWSQTWNQKESVIYRIKHAFYFLSSFRPSFLSGPVQCTVHRSPQSLFISRTDWVTDTPKTIQSVNPDLWCQAFPILSEPIFPPCCFVTFSYSASL